MCNFFTVWKSKKKKKNLSYSFGTANPRSPKSTLIHKMNGSTFGHSNIKCSSACDICTHYYVMWYPGPGAIFIKCNWVFLQHSTHSQYPLNGFNSYFDPLTKVLFSQSGFDISEAKFPLKHWQPTFIQSSHLTVHRFCKTVALGSKSFK